MDADGGCRPATAVLMLQNCNPNVREVAYVCADGRREAACGSRSWVPSRSSGTESCSQSAAHNNGGCSHFSSCTGVTQSRRIASSMRCGPTATRPMVPLGRCARTCHGCGRFSQRDRSRHAGPATCSTLDDIVVDVDEFDALLDDAERVVPDVAVDALRRGASRSGEVDRSASSPMSGGHCRSRRDWPSAGRRSVEQRAATLMSIGHHNRAIPELERLVAEQPLRERPVRLLMQALHVTGRRAEALRVYRAFRTRLAEETGLDPSRELVRSRVVDAGR